MVRNKTVNLHYVSDNPLSNDQFVEVVGGLTGPYILDGPLKFPHSLENTHVSAVMANETVEFEGLNELLRSDFYTDGTSKISIAAFGPSTGRRFGLVFSKDRSQFHLSVDGDSDAVDRKVQFLEDLPYVRNSRRVFIEEFDKIKAITDKRVRGIRFQEYVLAVQRFEGWKPENINRRGPDGVSIEELDTFAVTPGGKHVLTEVRWKGQPFSGDALDAISGKVARRADTCGLVVSMSGFTSPAMQRRKEHAKGQSMVFVDAADFERVVSGDTTLSQLFDDGIRSMRERLGN